MIEVLIAGATGPMGAICVLLLVLIGLYKLAVSHAVPLASTWIKDQRDNFKEIMREHAKDREIFKDSIQILATRSDKIEDDVEHIKVDVKKLLEKIQ